MKVILYHIKYAIKKYMYGLQKKMFTAILFIGVILTVSLNIAVISIAGNNMKEEVDRKLQNQTQQISNNLDLYFISMKNNIVDLATNQEVIDLMNGEYSNFRSFILHRDISSMLLRLVSSNLWNQFYLISFHKKVFISSDRQNNIGSYADYDIESSKWYDTVMGSQNDLVLLDDFIPPVRTGEDKFALVKRIKSYFPYETTGFIIISTNKTFFSDMIKSTSYTSIDFLIIADSEGKTVYSSNNEQIKPDEIDKDVMLGIIGGQINTYKSSTGRKYIINVNTSKETGWNVLCFSDEKTMVSNLYSMNTIIILVTSGCIGLLLILSYLVSDRFTKPIKKLMNLMHRAENENYRVVSDIESNDEVGDLSKSFNIMMKKFLENQVLRKETEIYALQQQINPHFLYNTLESIKSLAISNRNSDIRLIAEKLGTMFRYSIIRDNKMVCIKDEINHIENYIAIQKIRYEERFDVVYDVDEKIYDYQTLKFILQPIVENSIYHGIENLTENGLITIKGYFENDAVVFEIIDNGGGMDDIELEQLNKYISGEIFSISYKKTKSIGLRNIQERIHLFFGDDYGIQVFSKKEKGTMVKIKIPAQKIGGKV
jgi:two-component system, sensor histidine kinase YesM